MVIGGGDRELPKLREMVDLVMMVLNRPIKIFVYDHILSSIQEFYTRYKVYKACDGCKKTDSIYLNLAYG